MRSENEQIHYRAKFRLSPYSTTTPSIVDAYRQIYTWVRDKEQRKRHEQSAFEFLSSNKNIAFDYIFGNLNSPVGYSGGMTTGSRVSICTRAAFDDKRGKIPVAWAFEYDEPDSHYPFRHWHTCIGLETAEDDSCLVNIKVTYATLPDYVGWPLPEPDLNIPRIAKVLFSLPNHQACVGETVVNTSCTRLTFENFDVEFSDNLLSSQRELPLILITSDDTGRYPVKDPGKLANNLMGLANVFAADESDGRLKSKLFNLFLYDTPAYRYNCPKSSLRIYQPNINLSDEEDARRHLCIRRDRLSEYGNKTSTILNRSLGRSFLRGRGDIVDTSDIAWYKSRQSIGALRSRMAEMKRHAENETVAEAKRTEALAASYSQEAMDNLKELLSKETADRQLWEGLANDYADSNAAYEQRIEQLENSLLELDESENTIANLKYRLQEALERADRSEKQVATLRAEACFVEGLEAFPRTLEDELKFAANLWPSRIFVLPEAYDSARRYDFADLDEEWQILKSVATVMWQLKFGERPTAGDLYSEFRNQTSFDAAPTETKLTKNDTELMRLRQRTYNGKQVCILPHIKGNGRNRRDPFRLHFCFDDEAKLIVIGHCGSHLPTSGTARQ